MTSEELVIQLRSFLQDQTGVELERRVLRAAADLKDSVRDRVQNSGINSKGRPFAPYTVSYARQRKNKGFQVRKVDYTRSGRLWASISQRVVSNVDGVIVIEIGPKGEENEVKLLGPGTLKAREDGVQRGLPTIPNNEELSESFETLVTEIIEDFEKTVK